MSESFLGREVMDKEHIPYGRQTIARSDIDAVVSALKSPLITQGDLVPEFEKVIRVYCESKFAVAMNSATSALHAACLALDVGDGDLVWTTPISFVASANCALYCRAEVDFVDVDKSTGNMCPEKLKAKLEQASVTNRLPKVVIVVHFSGYPCALAQIKDLAIKYQFRIIEDASHALGARFGRSPIGSCRYSDITVFSFHPVKMITTGEGGAALTNDSEIAARLKSLRSHGIERSNFEDSSPGSWYYEMRVLGFNYRMTEFQAALGISQMTRLDEFLDQRKKIADRYDRFFSSAELLAHPLSRENTCQSSFHLYVVQLPDRSVRSSVFELLRANNIGVQIHYIPIHTHPYFRKLGFATGSFPNAEEFYNRVISLPIYPGLTEDDQCRVLDLVTRALA